MNIITRAITLFLYAFAVSAAIELADLAIAEPQQTMIVCTTDYGPCDRYQEPLNAGYRF